MAEEAIASGTPATVFVSYSRDDQASARKFIDLIEGAGFSVWWDGLLGGGVRYHEVTAAALEAAKAVVVLWSRTSVGSHWVHDEATRGRDRCCLVPVSIDGVPPPLGFGQFQTIDAARIRFAPGDTAADTLLAAVAALHDRPPPPPRPKPVSRGVDRRLLLAGGAGGLAIAGGGTAWWLLGRGTRDSGSVAVLPFENLSGDPSQGYFSDGVAAEIRSALSRNPRLKVAAETSTAQLREKGGDARDVARRLNVAYLLDGNVRRSSSIARIAVELTEGDTGFSKWAQSFDRPLTDVFAVQSEIARAVTEALSARLAGAASTAAGPVGGTADFAAYDVYLKGKALFDRASGEDSDRAALAAFNRAVAIDPAYGAALAARSRALSGIANQYLDGQDRRDWFSNAIDAANRAVATAPALADAYSALGFATFFGRLDARAARGPFERSASLGQGDSEILARYALYCARAGREGAAKRAIDHAVLLDPVNPRTLRSKGTVAFTARRYRDSIPPIEEALSLNPRMSGAHAAIGYNRLLLGEIDAAARAFATEPSALRRLSGTAMVAARRGDRAAARAAFAAIVAQFGNGALYEQVQVLAQWQDRARALAVLATARAAGEPGLALLRSDPLVDPLRGEPAFRALVKTMRFD